MPPSAFPRVKSAKNSVNKHTAGKRERDSSSSSAAKKQKKSVAPTHSTATHSDNDDDNEEEEEAVAASVVHQEHAAFDLPTTNKSASSLELLQSWFHSHRFTGLDQLELRPSSTCGDTLGCFAKRDFSVGETLFTVPQRCILGLGATMDHPIANFVFHEAKKHQCFERVTVELLIWLVMIDGKVCDHENENDDEDDDGDGEIPPLHVYLSSLADPSPSLLHWDPALLEALQNTNLGNSLNELQETLKRHAELLEDLAKWNRKVCERLMPAKHFHFDNLVWACGHYLSRRYPGHFASQIYKDLTVDDNKFSRENNFGNVGALVPLLDILNHNDEHEWLKFEVKNNALHVICNRELKAGDELYSNYGSLSNEQLLFAFGYAAPQNAHDVFSVKLKLPAVMPTNVGKKKGTVEAISKMFALTAGGWDGIPKDIFEALGSLTQATDNSYVPTPNEEGVYVEECGILLDYLMASILKMSVSHSQRSDILDKFGVVLEMKFPTDNAEATGSENEQELTLDESSLVPHATIKVKVNNSSSSGSSSQAVSAAAYPANVERAKYIAFYLLGQYRILMEAAHDLNEILGSEEQEEGEGEGEEDDDEEEEENEE